MLDSIRLWIIFFVMEIIISDHVRIQQITLKSILILEKL